MTDTIAETTVNDNPIPQLGLRWQKHREGVWVALCNGRSYYVEQWHEGTKAVAYDPLWPGRAVECDTFPEAIMAAQMLADGFDGVPDALELERNALIAIMALGKKLLGKDSRFEFRTLGQIEGDRVTLMNTQLTEGWPGTPLSLGERPEAPKKERARHLAIVKKND